MFRLARVARPLPILPACLLFFATHGAMAEGVQRIPLEDRPEFPISAAVRVGHEFDTVYVSGALPSVKNTDAPKGTVAAYGNTQEQTDSVLRSIRETLAKMGLGMQDIVKMTVFLVGDPTQGNKLDFAGMMAAYSRFFGTPEQPNKPARSAVQVAALVAPGALVEIEVIAVQPRTQGRKNP
jgi:enamine deaminase RidA (YjgF/YER057c/UK114 family)